MCAYIRVHNSVSTDCTGYGTRLPHTTMDVLARFINVEQVIRVLSKRTVRIYVNGFFEPVNQNTATIRCRFRNKSPASSARLTIVRESFELCQFARAAADNRNPAHGGVVVQVPLLSNLRTKYFQLQIRSYICGDTRFPRLSGHAPSRKIWGAMTHRRPDCGITKF